MIVSDVELERIVRQPTVLPGQLKIVRVPKLATVSKRVAGMVALDKAIRNHEAAIRNHEAATPRPTPVPVPEPLKSGMKKKGQHDSGKGHAHVAFASVVETQEAPAPAPKPSLESMIRVPSQFAIGPKGKTVFAACPLCGTNYRTGSSPHLLSCQHTFCKTCLEGLVSENRLECPRCKTETAVPNGVKDLPTNYALNSLGELPVDDLMRQTTFHLKKTLDAACPVCFEDFCNEFKPMSLGCGHTVCLNCVDLITQNAPPGKLACPSCLEISPLENVRENVDMLKTIDNVQKLRRDIVALKA